MPRELMKWIVLFLIIVAIGLFWWVHYGRIPAEQRIRTALMEAKEAIERKQFARCMRQISTRYRDSTGLTYDDIRRSMLEYARDPRLQVSVTYHAITIYVRGKTGVVDLLVQVTAQSGGHTYTTRPTSITVFFESEWARWKIVNVDGWQQIANQLPVDIFVQ